MNSERNTEAPAALGLPARIWRSWKRDSHLTLSRRVRKGVNFLSQLIRARSELKSCNRVGINARVAGRLRVINNGSITIGDHLNVNSSWVPIELSTGPQGRIQIGDEVLINFGALIAASSSVSIGSGSMIGPHCIISDVDLPEAAPGLGPVAASPIEIGRDVWLAGRVTVRPGVKIGDGAVVVAGSIVESDVPAHFMASGIPARLLPKLGSAAPPPSARAAASVRRAAAAKGPVLATPRGTLISDFQLEDLVYELKDSDENPAVEATVAAGPQLSHMLSASPGPARDFAVIWTRPEAAVPTFGRLLKGDSIHDRELIADVDAFCGLIQQCAANYRNVLVPTWTQPAYLRGRGFLDGRAGGILSTLSTMNLRLMRAVEARANVYVLDAARWQAAVGPAAFNPRGLYLAQMAMARPIVAEAARDIRAALAALGGRQRKVLVLRSEDLFWPDGQIGVGNAATVQAHVAYQQALRILKRRGVTLALLATAAKAEVLEAIRALPVTVLRQEDFAEFGLIEGDEAAKLAALSASLNVDSGAMVYIDGRDCGRARVRAAMPEIFVPDWPSDKLQYPSSLLGLNCFDTGSVPEIARLAATQ
jgi:acetyltransferase-like isoleucine patch superfamily enzyme